MQKADQPLVNSHCNGCLGNRQHDSLYQCSCNWTETDDEDNPIYEEQYVFDLLQCRGCKTISLRRTYTHSGMPEAEVDHFPPSISRHRPSWFQNLGFLAFKGPKHEIRCLLEEIYSATFSGSRRLALMGVRAVLDVALTDKLGDIGGFDQKLNAAVEKRWITPKHHEVLKATIDAGSAAAHRSYNPDKEHLDLVLDVVEHVIQLLYILEQHAEDIAKQTPKRGQVEKK